MEWMQSLFAHLLHHSAFRVLRRYVDNNTQNILSFIYASNLFLLLVNRIDSQWRFT